MAIDITIDGDVEFVSRIVECWSVIKGYLDMFEKELYLIEEVSIHQPEVAFFDVEYDYDRREIIIYFPKDLVNESIIKFSFDFVVSQYKEHMDPWTNNIFSILWTEHAKCVLRNVLSLEGVSEDTLDKLEKAARYLYSFFKRSCIKGVIISEILSRYGAEGEKAVAKGEVPRNVPVIIIPAIIAHNLWRGEVYKEYVKRLTQLDSYTGERFLRLYEDIKKSILEKRAERDTINKLAEIFAEIVLYVGRKRGLIPSSGEEGLPGYM